MNLACSCSVNSRDRNVGEHLFGFLASAEPRQRMRAYELGFRSGAGAHRRFGEPVGKGQICQPDGALGGSDEQVGIGREVGVEAQCGAADHDSDVVAVAAGGQFGGDQSAQPPQPGGRRALPAHLAVERMRHPDFDAAVDVVEGDQATGVGFLDGVGIGDPSAAPPARSARRRQARR